MEVQSALRAMWRETKEITGTVARRGWRPLIPWMFIAFLAVILYRIAMGLPLPDVAALIAAIGGFLGPTVVAQVTRSVEVRAGVGNNPPVVARGPGAEAGVA